MTAGSNEKTQLIRAVSSSFFVGKNVGEIELE